jgi:hypothetical protein
MAEQTYTFTPEELGKILQNCSLDALQAWADKIQLTIPSAVEEARAAMFTHLHDNFTKSGGDIIITKVECCPCGFPCFSGEPCCIG